VAASRHFHSGFRTLVQQGAGLQRLKASKRIGPHTKFAEGQLILPQAKGESFLGNGSKALGTWRLLSTTFEDKAQEFISEALPKPAQTWVRRGASLRANQTRPGGLYLKRSQSLAPLTGLLLDRRRFVPCPRSRDVRGAKIRGAVWRRSFLATRDNPLRVPQRLAPDPGAQPSNVYGDAVPTSKCTSPV